MALREANLAVKTNPWGNIAKICLYTGNKINFHVIFVTERNLKGFLLEVKWENEESQKWVFDVDENSKSELVKKFCVIEVILFS